MVSSPLQIPTFLSSGDHPLQYLAIHIFFPCLQIFHNLSRSCCRQSSSPSWSELMKYEHSFFSRYQHLSVSKLLRRTVSIRLLLGWESEKQVSKLLALTFSILHLSGVTLDGFVITRPERTRRWAIWTNANGVPYEQVNGPILPMKYLTEAETCTVHCSPTPSKESGISGKVFARAEP